MEINSLYIKKATMNKAEIIFDKIEKAIAWEEFLKSQHVQSVKTENYILDLRCSDVVINFRL